ncbi:MAG TPA: YggS family pyridoxal phosphate-dependent enzyme [Solirubrobacteraceae bacterium]|nr:YggS family pyridoxal phosphate-dependent enzyme [Solirubrobacteraceae bacterium]
MVELIATPDAARIRANIARIREEIAQVGAAAGRWSAVEAPARAAAEVQVLAAVKYVALADLPVLAQAGVTLVGENRAQDLQAKVAAHGELFEWDFIGQLQSRRVRAIVPHVRLIHSVASESALRELAHQREHARAGLELLIEVNVAREPGKAGIAPEQLEGFLEHAPLPVVGLMTMPPFADDPERSRRWFAALRELAAAHGLRHLSMGTSQDYAVAVAEGATIVRIGASLYA